MIAEKIKASQESARDRRVTESARMGTSTEAGPRLVDRAAPPDPEVPATATRRRFMAEYKLRILKEADACTVWEFGCAPPSGGAVLIQPHHVAAPAGPGRTIRPDTQEAGPQGIRP